jgi:MGT family glycosyltransferase
MFIDPTPSEPRADATRRRYLFALVDGGGTVPPELAAVRRMVERGHHVTVLAEDSMTDDVIATGARFRPWTSAPNRPSRRADDDPYRDWECTNPIQLFDRLLDKQFIGPAAAYAADVTTVMKEHRPDLVVCSMFALGAMVAAEGAGVPFDITLPNVYILPAPGMPPIGLGLRPAKTSMGRMRDRIITALGDRAWGKGLDPLNRLRGEYGLEPLHHWWDQAGCARRHLVMTSASFDFPAQLPLNARYVGAVLDDPVWGASAEPWQPPVDDPRPIVLVAMSSTFQDQRDALQRVIDALGQLDVRGLVTTGPAIDPEEFSSPSNVDVLRALPHSEVLPHAAVVVTHGGHGTVIKSLAAGVPVVVLPHGRDQADNAARVVSRNAGVKVKRSASTRAITRTIRSVLADESYRVHAHELGRQIRLDAASGALTRELEDLPLVTRC